MQQCARMVSTEAMKMTGQWARRLEQDAVLEFDVVEPEMLEPDFAKCIHESDEVEDPMPMSMAISRWRREGRRDRLEDDTPVDAAPMVSRMSMEAV